MRDIVAEYLEGAEDLLGMFRAPVDSLFAGALRSRPWGSALADSLRDYQKHIGGDAAFNGNEAVVATGQQPGIFCGPLYTVLKAASAVKVAQRVTADTGTPCVPLFWVGSDDHDFEEARATYLLTLADEPLEVVYTPEADVEGMPLYGIPAGHSLHAQIDLAARECRGSELRDEVAAFLHESLDASASLGEWTARLMARLFRGTGLVIFAPELPAARQLSAEVMAREIASPLSNTALVNRGADRLEEMGLPPQLRKGDSECAFFLDVDGRRRKVTFEDGRFVLPEVGECYTAPEMESILSGEPGRFTPNVALRCIVQQHLFPVAAYVAGPGEMAYWAQLEDVFAHHGLDMPVVYPRARAVLGRVKLFAWLRESGLTLADLSAGEDAAVDKALRTLARGPGREALSRRARKVDDALADLAADLEKHSAVAADMATRLGVRAREEIERIDGVLTRENKGQVDAAAERVRKLCNCLAPWRKPQERVYTVFSFLFEHGWGLIPRLLDELDAAPYHMNEVEL